MKTPMRYLAATTCNDGSKDSGLSGRSAPKSTDGVEKEEAPMDTGELSSSGALLSRLL